MNTLGESELERDWSAHWGLDPAVVFLNHGSFGATPSRVLESQRRARDRMELEPVRFFVRELEPLLDDARRRVARFVDAEADGLVLVPNASTGINAVLRSLDLRSGDELLTTDHAYNAARNTLDFVAGRSGARVVTAVVPFPIDDPSTVIERIVEKASPRTRLAMIDHVTSQTALVFPAREIVQELASRGIDTLIDGAHAPGMLPLSLTSIGAAYYTANLHKWVCAPKGAGFLWTRADLRSGVRPAIISHGANSTRRDRSRYLIEFGWTGTFDPSAMLASADAIDILESLLPDGWPRIMERNHALACFGRDLLCDLLGVASPAPDSMLGSMAAIPLPDGVSSGAPPALYGDPIQDALFDRHAIEIPVIAWPSPPARLIRLSAHLHNQASHYRALARALGTELESETRRRTGS